MRRESCSILFNLKLRHGFAPCVKSQSNVSLFLIWYLFELSEHLQPDEIIEAVGFHAGRRMPVSLWRKRLRSREEVGIVDGCISALHHSGLPSHDLLNNATHIPASEVPSEACVSVWQDRGFLAFLPMTTAARLTRDPSCNLHVRRRRHRGIVSSMP